MSEKWWDMSDDELDDLFREASDKVDVPFESSSFDKLRQKIDIQRIPEPPKGYKKRWLVLLAGLFLMVGVGLVYHSVSKKQGLTIDVEGNNSTEILGDINHKKTIEHSKSSSPVSSEIIEKEEIKKESTLLTPENLPQESVISQPLSVSPQTTGNNVEKSYVRTKANVNNETHSQTTVRNNLGQSSVGTQTTAEKSFEKTHTTAKNIDSLNTSDEVVENKSITSVLNNSKTYSIEQNKVIENIKFNSYNTKNQLHRFNISKNNKDRKGKNYPSNSQIIEQNSSPFFNNLITIQDQNKSEETVNKTNFYDVDFLKNKGSKSLLTDIHTELPDYVDSLPRTIKPVKFSKFGVRLVISPDFNSIENMGKMALGGSLGLLFEYKVSKKLVVQTGMVYSSKRYVGSFDDYHNWKDWKGYHPSKPTEVDGGCTVFDIPINLRLNLFQKPKQTWFVSSGVSSYWMINENYTYNYAWAPSRAVDWSDNSKYYFSVLNFSVGLERQISKRFSLQVEPYLKTPLKNVGRGGVSLYSSGLLFSSKYEF